MDNFLSPEVQNMLRFRMMGQSGGFRPMSPEDEMLAYNPDMLNARLGLGGQNADAGVTGNLIRLPDGRVIRQYSGDVGYRTPFMGGTAGVNVGVAPRGMHNARISYERSF